MHINEIVLQLAVLTRVSISSADVNLFESELCDLIKLDGAIYYPEGVNGNYQRNDQKLGGYWIWDNYLGRTSAWFIEQYQVWIVGSSNAIGGSGGYLFTYSYHHTSFYDSQKNNVTIAMTCVSEHFETCDYVGCDGECYQRTDPDHGEQCICGNQTQFCNIKQASPTETPTGRPTESPIETPTEAPTDAATSEPQVSSSCFDLVPDGVKESGDYCKNVKENDACVFNCLDGRTKVSGFDSFLCIENKWTPDASQMISCQELPNKKYTITITVISSVLLCGFAIFCYYYSKRGTKTPKFIPFSDLTVGVELSSGHFGKVLKASWNGKQVVCKVPRRGIGEDEMYELMILKNVNKHFNFVKFEGICLDFIDKCQDDKRTTTAEVLEFVPHGTLRDFILNLEGPLSEGDIATLALGMAKGVNHLHEHNYIHRDIALRNFLLRCTNPLEPVLTDFGLSRPLDKNGIFKPRACHNETLPWRLLDPDCLTQGRGIFTQTLDVWMFGVCVWQLLSAGTAVWKTYFDVMGEPWTMFGSIEDLGRFLVVAREQKETVMVYPAGTSLKIQGIIRKCCALDAENRPDMKYVIAELEQINGVCDSTQNSFGYCMYNFLMCNKGSNRRDSIEMKDSVYLDYGDKESQMSSTYRKDSRLVGGYTLSAPGLCEDPGTSVLGLPDGYITNAPGRNN